MSAVLDLISRTVLRDVVKFFKHYLSLYYLRIILAVTSWPQLHVVPHRFLSFVFISFK